MKIDEKKCRNCKLCTVDEICPAAAVYTNLKGFPEIDETACTECLRCVGSCKFGALYRA